MTIPHEPQVALRNSNATSRLCARGLTLLETLAATILLAIIIATVMPLLRNLRRDSSEFEQEQPILINRAALLWITEAFATTPETFGFVFSKELVGSAEASMPMTALTIPDELIEVWPIALGQFPTSPLSITVIHTFDTNAQRFAVVELSMPRAGSTMCTTSYARLEGSVKFEEQP